MSAFNAVRFHVKPGREQDFLDAHRKVERNWPGMKSANIIKTGDNTFCIIGEWGKFQNIVDARPQMIGMLDSLREHLEDLGGGLGLTDPVSGEAVVRLPATKPARKKARGKAKKAKRKSRR